MSMEDVGHPYARQVKSAERVRLAEDAESKAAWKLWGPYLSERQWGTVREDYSADGKAWEYFSHGQARSRAYRWGEDGIAGISDRSQRLCLALALWNGKDPILKERLFGLTNGEGNHGEDVKELYYYLDATPTHSYLKYLTNIHKENFRTHDWSKKTAAAAGTNPSSSCWIPAYSMTTAISTCLSNTPSPGLKTF
jgi:hypothetical protein